MNKARLEGIKKNFGGPITDSERQLLEDIKAWIDFCVDNGLSFRTAIGTLAHDVNGILAPDGYYEKGIFTPKVTGYTRVQAEMAMESAAIASDPSMQPGHQEQD